MVAHVVESLDASRNLPSDVLSVARIDCKAMIKLMDAVRISPYFVARPLKKDEPEDEGQG